MYKPHPVDFFDKQQNSTEANENNEASEEQQEESGKQ